MSEIEPNEAIVVPNAASSPIVHQSIRRLQSPEARDEMRVVIMGDEIRVTKSASGLARVLAPPLTVNL